MRTMVVATAVIALVAGCGGSGSSSTVRSSAATAARSTHAPPNVFTRSSSCIPTNGYGGLGGSQHAFAANNNNSTGPAEPTPGAAWYQVIATQRGCVTAYSLQESGPAPLGAHAMLVLLSRGYLPADAEQVVNTSSCAVWRSATLRRAIGLLYAKATAIAQAGSAAGSARIEATSHSAC